MNIQKWTSLSILDALRPDTGWKTDHAVFGSYSADPVALVAILLALAGRDDERGLGTAVDFAEAIEELRGKVCFLVQSGRISVPFKSLTVLKVLDGFVREVNCDEAVESWHPKVALIRQSSELDGNVSWRFWLGSRNFTRDRSWDAGLLLVGNVEAKGKPVTGLTETAKELWSRAGLSRVEQNMKADELSRVHWIHPQGCKVEEIQFLLPQMRERKLPAEPRRIESLLVVSPFLDGETIAKLGQWGTPKTHRTLLSTYRALSGIAEQQREPLRNYFSTGDVLFMDAFDEDEILAMTNTEEASDETSDDADEDHIGLHAKLILACRKSQSTLWLGSPNATKRAWEKNYEIVARIAVNKDLTEELIKFAKKAQVFVAGDSKPEPISKEQEVIDAAHKQVVSRWQVNQKDWTLYADEAPHPDNPNIVLEVGILGSSLMQWPRQTKVMKLHRGSPPIETELVQIRISYKNAERRWLQKAPLNPPPGVDRDRSAVATLFKPSTFLKWLRTLLDDELPPNGEPWDLDPGRKKEGTKLPQQLNERIFPTLEDVLKAWSRNPDILKVVDARLKAYMDFIRTSSTEENKELIQLKEFDEVWKIVRTELLK